MPLTSAIYSEDGTINWSDNSIRDKIFAHGDERRILENYVFMYDVFKLRSIVNSTSFKPDEKTIAEQAEKARAIVEQAEKARAIAEQAEKARAIAEQAEKARSIAIRAIAKQLFTKHIFKIENDNSLEIKIRYSVYHSNRKSDVEAAINIGDVLYKKFEDLNSNIETKTIKDIMDAYEEAVSEIRPSLGLPTRIARQRQVSGVVHATEATSNTKLNKKGAFMLFTPTRSDDGFTWARPSSDLNSSSSSLSSSPLPSPSSSSSTNSSSDTTSLKKNQIKNK